MKKILCLCINLLLFIITDAVPLKLIAGDRSVVKKDGATHTISKYYVVPNDFDQNNTTNTTETSQTVLRLNHSLYSKSMDAITASEHQLSEKRAEAANNQTNENNAGVNNSEVNLLSDLDDAQVVVGTQAGDNTSESTESVNTEQSLDPDDLGNLQVEPITNFSNKNISFTNNEVNVYDSSETLQNGTSLIVENTTQNFETDLEDELDDLILTKFGTAVHKSSAQNLESFWKLIKLYIDRISNDDELLAKIEKLSLLLNIFTNLHEAALWQKPIESMLDSIIDILQIPFVEKSNTNESQSQTNVSGEYDEECFRKCGVKRSKPQLDSNGNYLSETESLEASDNLELKNIVLQRRQSGDSDDEDDWVNTSNDPGSNQMTVSNQPTNILRSQLIVPSNLIVDVPDEFNVRYSTPTLNHIARENKVQEDPKPIQTNPDSAEIEEHLDDQPLTIESTLIDDLPWHIEDKRTDYLPWYSKDKTTNQPWIVEHKTINTLPWIIEDRGNKKVPWKVKNRADPNWFIENDMGHSPITLYQSRDPSVITHGGKILLHPNQHKTSSAHRVKQGGKKLYHVYTYVINPATSLYEIPNSGNIAQVESRQFNANPKTKSYGLSTSHGGNEIVYTNKHYPSYFESQFSLSKPNVLISSQTSNSELNYVPSPSGTNNEVNASDLSDISNEDDQPKYLVGYEPQSNDKPALLQPNTLPSDSLTNSDQDNELPPVPEVGSHPGVLLPNVPSKSLESLIDLVNTGPESSASASASADTQTSLHPVSKASFYSEHTNLPDDYYKPSPVYDRETYKYPGLIATASPSSAYANLLDLYDKPVYGGQTHQNPTLISSSASSSSGYTNLPDDYNEPSPVYGGHTDKHPSFISPSSSSSAYTNLPDEYDEPVNGGQTHQHPALISSSASSNSEYTNFPDDYDDPSPVYVGHTDKHPSLISTYSSSSAHTNLPDEYDEPVNGGQIQQYPALISSSASSNSEFTNFPDDYDEPSPVYVGHTDKHPGLISTYSSSSAYTNLPDEYDNPVNVVPTHQHPGLISSAGSLNSEYTNVVDDYTEPNPIYGGQTHMHPGLISNNPIPNYGHHSDIHPGQITKVTQYPEYANVVNDYDEPISVYGEQIHKHPGFISEASSHSEFTNIPNDYNNQTPDYEEETDQYPVHIQTPVNGRPTEIEDNLLVSHHPYGQTVHIIQPNLIAHLHENQPTGHNYLKHLKLKLAPTYRLFTLDNLYKLHDAVIKTIEINGDEPDVYDNTALMNLRKIIKIILIFAELSEEPEGSIEWYEKIFYNTQKNRHPVEIYVYNLIRQRWLHELMLVLYKNEFNFNILQNPRLLSFLELWQFPNYVLKFMETEELIQHNFDLPEVFNQMISSQYSVQDEFATHTYDDVLEEVPENLESYVTKNVIDSYKTPNVGIVLSIAGVEAEPDANAIIQILQKYLHYKSFIEKQENVIIRDNKVEMLKQIIFFLREKGYDAITITDLVRKLYTAVYSTEGKGCQTHHANFAKNMYDVILPVLRRSGR